MNSSSILRSSNNEKVKPNSVFMWALIVFILDAAVPASTLTKTLNIKLKSVPSISKI